MAKSSEFIARMTQDELTATLRAIVDGPTWAVTVELSSGAVMIGDLLPSRVPYEDVGSKPYAHYPARWAAPDDPDSATALWLRDVELVYPVGGTSRSTAICHLEAPQIATIQALSWDLGGLSVSALAGALGEALYAANESAAAATGVRTFGFVSASLRVPQQVDADGIYFSTYEPLYTDYAYLNRHPSLSVSVGALGIGSGYSRGVDVRAKAVLRGSLFSSLTLPRELVRLRGLITPAPILTETVIEGEEWQLFVFTPTGASHHCQAALFKRSAINYPIELWPFLKSSLTLLAEERQIPLQVAELAWPKALVARAMAFVP